MDTPVAFIVFNRPDVTARVFQAIADARPKTLLIVADGPRPERPGEADRCAAVRAIVERVDWPCEVLRNYSDTNLGCRDRVSTGIDWVFSQVEEAIILEDDCLPCPDFFSYCTELLTRYRHDERIMHISGSNPHADRTHNGESYYFSRYPFIWGWATWRRAWRHYDVAISSWPSVSKSAAFTGMFGHEIERRYFMEDLAGYYHGRPNTWDIQWTYACWCQGGLSITPEVNLISNIGFGPDATHTVGGDSRLANLGTGQLGPWRHPELFLRHTAADDHFFFEVFGGRRFAEMQKPYRRMRRAFGEWRRGAGRWVRKLLVGS